ncbi:MAG TPA: ClpXP protease specificity-enhancing factor [Gammaproteobacteria bacterium]|jgi:stringent starvation protein B
MTSSKPYLVRALCQWIVDNGKTPHILIDTTLKGVVLPPGIGSDGSAVLNLAPQAVQKLEMTNEHVAFSARFNGVVHDVYCPIESLLGIYARETGKGMMFPPEEDVGDDGTGDDDKPRGPSLTVVK